MELDEICEFINGGPWSDGEYSDFGIRVVKVSNMEDGTIVPRNDDNYLPESKYEKYKKHELRTDDIVIATVGSHPTQQGSVVGRTSLIPANYSGSFLNQNAVCMRVNRLDLCSQRYLFYLSKTVLFKHHIESRARGSANQVRMAVGELKKFKADLPAVSIQRKIAAVLSGLDLLIENNRRRIALLETLAEEIYREWFVRLRFPGNHKVKTVKGLPETWEINRVKEIVVRKSFGRIYREGELFNDGQVVVIDQSRADSLGYYDGEPQHVASQETPIILFGDHTCKMVFMMKPFSLAENVIPFVPKPGISTYFVFHLVRNLARTTEYKRHWTDLINREVLLPKEDLQVEFETTVRHFHQQIELLRQAIRKTEKIRDLILPRLLSDKLSVENLDIQFPHSMTEELNAKSPSIAHA